MKLAIAALAGATALAGLGIGEARAATTGAIGYTLADGGASLVVIPRLDRSTEARSVPLSFGDGATTTLDSIALRPNGRRLYGLSLSNGGVYEIDTDTGAARLAATLPAPTSATTTSGFDFNNQLDAARAVTGNDENFVFFPADRAVGDPAPASVVQVTDLFYVDGDPNAGADPMVIGNAYTNAVFPPPDDTLQYVLDSGLDVLATLGNNAGTLMTVGMTGVDFGDMGGFDILSRMPGDNEALALLTVDGTQSIFSIDLSTGAAMFAGAAPTQFGNLDGFAVAPIPLPAPIALLGLGLLGLAGLRARRRPAAAA